MLVLLLTGLLLTGCSAQVTGMQSPVLHDYGEIEWVPLTQVYQQGFISGPGYSAAIQNDAETTPEEYLERLAALPEDAVRGQLSRLEIGLRLAGHAEGKWNTGARLQIVYTDTLDGQASGNAPIIERMVDDLPRSGERVILSDLPDIAPARAVVINLIPGDGSDSERLEVGITPHRAPYAGWRAVSGGEVQGGALVFQTVYQRDVAVAAVIESGLGRVGEAGAGFQAVYSVVAGGLLLAVVILWRIPARRVARGR